MESGSRVPSTSLSEQAWDRQTSSMFAVAYGALENRSTELFYGHLELQTRRISPPPTHTHTYYGLHSSELSQNLFRCKAHTVLSGKLQGCGRKINKGSDSSKG